MTAVQNRSSDLSRGTILLTGANGSLGLSFVEYLLQRHPSCTVILTVRDTSPNDEHTEKLRAIVAKFPEAKIFIEHVDLGSLESVRSFAASTQGKVKAKTIPPITVVCIDAYVLQYFIKDRHLICNAFSWSLLGLKFSQDNYELGFQVSHLSHFLLILKLLDSMNHQSTRIVFLGSEAHDAKNKNAMNPLGASIPKNLEELVHPPEDPRGEQSKRGFQRYGNSKLANVMLMYSLKDRLAKNPVLRGMEVLTIDPGGMPTSRAFKQTPFMIRTAMYVAGNFVLPIIKSATNAIKTTDDAAKDLYMMSLGSGNIEGAGYFIGQKSVPSSEDSQNKQIQEELWFACSRWAGLKDGEAAL